jgi:hypothetical protein
MTTIANPCARRLAATSGSRFPDSVCSALVLRNRSPNLFQIGYRCTIIAVFGTALPDAMKAISASLT